VVALLAIEFALSSRPKLPNVFPFSGADKLIHAGYFGLTALFALYAGREEGWSERKAALVTILGTLAWGITDELHQSYVPNRTPEAADVLADVTGAALAAAAARMLKK
jgi:VanZ family protein